MHLNLVQLCPCLTFAVVLLQLLVFVTKARALVVFLSALRHIHQYVVLPGYLVWRWYPSTANAKLGLGWVGPYKVLTKVSITTYQIQHQVSNKILVVHVDHLKRCHTQQTTQKEPNSPEEDKSANMSKIVISNDERGEGNCENNNLNSKISTSPYQTRVGRTVKPKVIFSPS